MVGYLYTMTAVMLVIFYGAGVVTGECASALAFWH